jgi:hypothetical protein
MKRGQRSVWTNGWWLLVAGVLGLTACSSGSPSMDQSTGAGPSTGSKSSAAGTGGGHTVHTTSSTSAAASSGGTGGMVTFNWPETPPGAGCLAGHYTGTLSGTYKSSIFPLPIPVSGIGFNITLGQASPNGEFLNVSNGSLTNAPNSPAPFGGQIVGTLDCKNLTFNSKVVMGSYNAGGTIVDFSGEMVSGYDEVKHAFINGAWNWVEANPAFGGNGTWNATWTGP